MDVKKLFSSTALIALLSLTACGGSENSMRGKTAITDETPIIDVSALDRKDLDLMPLSAEDRFIKLESEVQQLQADMSTMKQAFSNIAAIESNIQGLLTELRGLKLVDDTTAMPSTTASAIPAETTTVITTTTTETAPAEGAPLNITKKMQPIVESAPKKITPKKPVATSNKTAQIDNIRIGADTNRTRIVFDVIGKVNYDSDFDTEENLLMVTFKDLKAAESIKSASLKGGKVTNATITTDNGETIVAFSVKPGSTMQKQDMIPPSSDNPYTRLFFDFN
ncbi:MAG: hypothetical protein CMH30_05195 [Micavibrio sp.]|nr:hypothetical protein [Micavibrio sp.]